MQRGEESTQRRGEAGGEASLRSPKVSAAEFAMYMKGIDFPADKQKLVQIAKSNGAPENVISYMNRLPSRQYNRVTEIEQEFSKLK